MATATEELKPEMTTEEIAEMASNVSSVLFGEPTKTAEETAKAKAATEAGAKAKVDAQAKEEADRKAAEKAEADKKAKAEKADTASAAAAGAGSTGPTAAEIADKVAERMKPRETPKQQTAAPELSADDKHNRAVLAAMAKETPEYERLLKRFDAFIPAEKAYRESWEKNHAGQTYDPADADHEDFYKANDPIQTEKDQEAFNRAQNRFEARQIAEETVNERETGRLRTEAIQSVKTKLATHQDDMAKELLAGIDPELGKADLKKLREENPQAAVSIKPYLPGLVAMTAELTKAFTPHLNYHFTDANPLHVTIMQTIYSYENELLGLAPKDRMSNGRALAPIEEYNKMTPEQKDKHWTIWMQPEAVKALLVRDFSARAREDYELLKPKTGKAPTGSAGNGTPKTPDEKPKEPVKDKGTKEFPNLASGASDGTGSSGAGLVNESDAKKISASLFAS